MAGKSNDFDRIRKQNQQSGPQRLRPVQSERKIHTTWLKGNKR